MKTSKIFFRSFHKSVHIYPGLRNNNILSIYNNFHSSQIVNNKNEISTNTLNQLINEFAANGKYDNIEELIYDEKLSKKQLDTTTYQSYLQACFKFKKFDKITEIIKEMDTNSQLDTNTYNILIKMYGNSKLIDKMYKTVSDMKKQHISMNVDSFNYVLEALLRMEGRGDEIQLIWENMHIDNIKPNETTYNLYLRHLCFENKFDKIRDILHSIKNENISVEKENFNLLIPILFNLHLFKEICEFFEIFVKNENFFIEKKNYDFLIQTFIDLQEDQKLKKNLNIFFSSPDQPIKIQFKTFKNLFKYLGNSSANGVELENLIIYQEKLDYPLDPQISRIIIKNYLNSSQIDKMGKMYNLLLQKDQRNREKFKISEKNDQKKLADFNILLMMFSGHCKNLKAPQSVEKVEEFFNLLKNEANFPSYANFIYNHVIYFFCSFYPNLTEKIKHFVEEAKKNCAKISENNLNLLKSISPATVRTLIPFNLQVKHNYENKIKQHAENREIRLMEEYFQLLKSNVTPTVFIYQIVISVYSKCCLIQKMEAAFQEMRKFNIQPTPPIIYSLRYAYLRAGLSLQLHEFENFLLSIKK